MTTWVNFKELREQLDFREVLVHYGVKINARNHTQHTGKCPLPTHPGVRKQSSFSAHLHKGIFRCFGCGAQGNVIDFACRMETLDPARPDDVRKAAVILAERYGISSTPPKRAPPKKAITPASNVVVNAPLDFALKGLDPDHPYLRKCGFTPVTIDRFELGYASRGLMQGRIAIPLRNAEGQLVGYAGKLVDDSLINEENPKYRFPTAREHDGKRYEFDKSLLLYGAHAIEQPTDDLTIVTGFRSVWWLWQCGHRNVVALMGSSCSSQQARLIVGMTRRTARITVFTDGNKAGRYCAEEMLRLLVPYRFCRWVQLKFDSKPAALSQPELAELLPTR